MIKKKETQYPLSLHLKLKSLIVGLLFLPAGLLYSQDLLYSGNPYCNTDPATASPTITGGVSGTFSIIYSSPSTATLMGFNTTNGSFMPNGSSAGTYLVKFVYSPGMSPMKDSLLRFIFIDSLPSQQPIISYSPATLCPSAAGALPTLSGITNGFFKIASSTPGISVDPITGLLNLSSAMVNAQYDILYVYSSPLGACVDSVSTTITIGATPNANFMVDSLFCETDPIPTITYSGGGASFLFSSSPKNIIKPLTSNVNLLGNAGTYVITNTVTQYGCTVSASKSITIDTLPNVPPTIGYPQTTYCKDAADPVPTITGITNGRFSVMNNAIPINAQSGQLDLSMGTAGTTYTIIYTYMGPQRACSATVNTQLMVVNPPSANFSYPDSIFCKNRTGINATTAGTGNVFTSFPVGLISNPNNGAINFNSPANTYIVTNSRTENGCTVTASKTITLENEPTATITYGRARYCSSAPDTIPRITGVKGGVFLATPPQRLRIDPTSGLIKFSESVEGQYTVKYVFSSPSGRCVDTARASIEILRPPNPSFRYSSSFFCKNEPDPSPVDTINSAIITNGNFSYVGNPTSLMMNIDGMTGEIDLINSDVGTYIVTNELTGNGCSESFSFSVTINDTIPSSFSYTGSPFCQSAADPKATITGAQGGTFSSSGGLVFADSVTGLIDLDMSTPGSYTISYLSPGGCGNTSTFPIEILAATDSPDVSLQQTAICSGDPLPTVNITGTVNTLVWYSSINPQTIIPVTGTPSPSALGFDSSMVGTKTVYVTDLAPARCISAFVPLSLTVNNRATVSISLLPSVTTSCSNQEITVIASSGPTNYQFLVNGVDSSGTTTSNTYKLSNFPTNPTAIQVIGNPGSCPANSNTINLSVTQAPTATPIQTPPFIFGPTPTPVSLNNLFTLNPTGSIITFDAPRGVTSSGSAFFFNPADPSINGGVLDSVTVGYKVRRSGSPACEVEGSFKVKIDPNNKLANALRNINPNRTPINNSFCNDLPPFNFYVIMGGFSPNTNISRFYVDSAGVALDTLTPTLVRGDTFQVSFDPRSLNPGNYSFQLESRMPGQTSMGISQGGFIFTIKEIPPDPIVLAPASPSCEGAVNDLINITNFRSGTKYLWYTDPLQQSPDTTTTGAGFNTGDKVATMGNQVTYFVRSEQQLCKSNGFDTVSLTIYPIPGPLSVTPLSVDFCDGDRVPSVRIQTSPGNQIFDWYNSQDSLLISTASLTFNPTPFDTINGSGAMILKVVERAFSNATFRGCSSIGNATSISINQIGRPQAPTLLDSSRQEICAGAMPDSFAVREVGDIIWWSDQALTDSVFGGNPIPANRLPIDINRVGTDRVYVTIANQGCNSSPVFYEFNVNPQPTVSFSNLDSVICNGQGDIRLFGGNSSPFSANNPGISFTLKNALTGNTVSNAFNQNLLKTDSISSGRYDVTYTFTDARGCQGDTTQAVSINPSPVADFTSKGNCVGDRFELIDNSSIEMTGQDSIVIKAWDYFTRRDTGDTSFVAVFPNSGFIKATLEVISNNNCTDTEVKDIFIGSNPQADFTWSNRCEGDTTVFRGFTDRNVLRADEQISSFMWDFGQGFVATGSQIDTFNFTAQNVFDPDVYDVSFMLTNSSRDPSISTACSTVVTHKVYIHPTVEVNPERDYFEDFESADHGWLAQPIKIRENDVPDWMLGVPQGSVINSAASGSNAWVTGLDTTYSPGEQSWVVSPCFDLRKVNRPMLNLDIWSHTVEGRDGAVIEVSADDGESWKVLGFFKDGKNTGINWYNQNTISAKPGEQAFGFGWSGEDANWKNARHKLDEFIRRPNVRFRIAFGSDENHTKGQDSTLDRGFNGFAFDNFFVGERKRGLLLEHFTNLNVDSTSSNRAAIYGLTNRYNNQLDLIPIQYHVAFPMPGDRINRLNEDDPEARAFQYAIPYVGRVALNGNEYFDASYFKAGPVTLLKEHQTLIDTQALEDPLFSIKIDSFEIINDLLQIQAEVTANKSPYPDEEVFVFVAVMEDTVIHNGGQLRSVLRKMVPNNGGLQFFAGKSWDQDSSQQFQLSWALDRQLFDSEDQLYAVVFVQEKGFNKVYQAVSTRSTSPGIPFFPVDLSDQLAKGGIAAYPNPVQDVLYIQIRQENPAPLDWKINDVQGKILGRGHIDPDPNNTFFINMKDLPAGLYLVQMKDTNGNIFQKRVVKGR